MQPPVVSSLKESKAKLIPLKMVNFRGFDREGAHEEEGGWWWLGAENIGHRLTKADIIRPTIYVYLPLIEVVALTQLPPLIKLIEAGVVVNAPSTEANGFRRLPRLIEH